MVKRYVWEDLVSGPEMSHGEDYILYTDHAAEMRGVLEELKYLGNYLDDSRKFATAEKILDKYRHYLKGE